MPVTVTYDNDGDALVNREIFGSTPTRIVRDTELGNHRREFRRSEILSGTHINN